MDIENLLEKYREAALKAGDITNTPKQHYWFDKSHEYYKKLKESEEGRNGIIKLMNDENVHVRLAAAAHSLQWVENKARKVLEDIQNSDLDFEDVHAKISAKYTLIEFDKGNLKFDY